MNKRKLILKVEKINLVQKRITNKDGSIDLTLKIDPKESMPKVSYWEAFQIMSKQPKLTFYRELEDQGW